MIYLFQGCLKPRWPRRPKVLLLPEFASSLMSPGRPVRHFVTETKMARGRMNLLGKIPKGSSLEVTNKQEPYADNKVILASYG